ncbi:MAG: hypothetical protein NTX50_32320, partial [Candidatus Sumerlaeota bacterium]|nr:hypothetical protein [Candidatus Sumerlaeota bacterium]
AGLYHKISAVQCAGVLTKIYTETDIDLIETTGALRSLTARNAYVKRIAASEVGTVRISAMPALVSGGAQWFTSIYSGEDNPKGSLDPSMAPLKVNLSGVGLTELRAPSQSATIALASKKWRRQGISDFSSALINYMETNVISAGEIKSLTVRGGSIQPYMIEASAPSANPSRITASYALFTFSLAGRRFGYLFDGAIYPDYLLSRAARLSATANGGDLFAIAIYCEHEITQLTARFKYSSLIKDSWGGGVVADVIRSGYYPTTPSLVGAPASGSSGASGIKSIQADCGVNVFYDSSSGATYALTGDIRAGDGCGASIGKIKTLKPSVKKLPGWVKTIEGPRVYGRGYSADEPKIINGSYDAYFVWFPCGH